MAVKRFGGQAPGQYYANLFDSYIRRNQSDRSVEVTSWKFYSGLHRGQWDIESLQQLIDERRPPHQANFIQNKIDTLHGNYLQNPLELRYEAEVDIPNNITLALNQLFLIDKERGEWKKAKRELIRSGLVHRGIVEMYKDYRNDPLGTIGLRKISNDRILFDPDWKSDDINDNKTILQYTWMDPEEIELFYQKKKPELREAIKIWKQNKTGRGESASGIGHQSHHSFHGSENIDKLYDTSPQFSKTNQLRFLVIQAIENEKVRTGRVFDTKANQFLPTMSPENLETMMNLRGTELRVFPGFHSEIKIVTTVPGLSFNLMLEDGDHPVQIGRVPIFTWSALNLNGEIQGKVPVMQDMQEIFNKRESTATHIQMTAVNGAELVEDDFFADDTEYDRYKREKNMPGSSFKVRSGTISQGKVGIANRPRDTQGLNDLHVTADRALNMADRISSTPSPITGGAGKSGESGKLFEEKRLQALTALEPMSESLQDLERELGEAYIYMVPDVYGNAPRRIKNPKTKEVILLNVPTTSGTIINDIRKMGRHGIIVGLAKGGVTVKRELLVKYIDALAVIQNPMLRSFLEIQLVQVLPNLPDDIIAQGKKVAELFLDVQIGRTMVEKAQLAQAMQQLQAAVQGGGFPRQGGPSLPGETPAEGGGFSAEGAKIPTQGAIPVDINNINQLR